MEVVVLVSTSLTKKFSIFLFSFEDTITDVLLQKNCDGLEHVIFFFSKKWRNSELKYITMEKQAYALGKALDFFRIFITSTNSIGVDSMKNLILAGHHQPLTVLPPSLPLTSVLYLWVLFLAS